MYEREIRLQKKDDVWTFVITNQEVKKLVNELSIYMETGPCTVNSPQQTTPRNNNPFKQNNTKSNKMNDEHKTVTVVRLQQPPSLIWNMW